MHVQCPTVGALNAHCAPTALRAGNPWNMLKFRHHIWVDKIWICFSMAWLYLSDNLSSSCRILLLSTFTLSIHYYSHTCPSYSHTRRSYRFKVNKKAYCKTANIRVQENFANFADFRKFANFSCREFA